MRVVGVCEPSSWCSPLPVIACVSRVVPIPSVAPGDCRSAPVLALSWCSHRIAAVIGGVAVIGCAVVVGVLPGVVCTAVLLVETSLVLLKLKEKNNSRVGPGGVTSQPRRWSLLWSPRSCRGGAAWLLFSLPLPPWSHLGGGGGSRRCCTSRGPDVVMVPVPISSICK